MSESVVYIVTLYMYETNHHNIITSSFQNPAVKWASVNGRGLHVGGLGLRGDGEEPGEHAVQQENLVPGTQIWVVVTVKQAF